MPTLKELKKLATARKIKGRSKMNKAQLMTALGVTAVKKSRKPRAKKSRKSRIKIPKGPAASADDGGAANSTIDLLRKTEVASTTYTASMLMQEIELLYLIKTYNPCYLIGSLISGFEIDDLSLAWDESQNKIYEPMGLAEGIKKCRASGKRFSILSIIIRGWSKKAGRAVYPYLFHANYLLYDAKKNEIERFEPHGRASTFTGIEINRAFKNLFAKYGIKYISQFDFCPLYGPQKYDRFGDKRSGDPPGFCQVWSTYWIAARLANPNVSREKLIKYLIDKNHRSKFRSFIRNFSVFLLTEKDKILDEFEARFGYRFPENRPMCRRQVKTIESLPPACRVSGGWTMGPTRAQVNDLGSILREVILQSHKRNKK